LEGFDIAETAKLDDFLDGHAGKKPREFEVSSADISLEIYPLTRLQRAMI
jgi:hypothetical protein